MSKCLISIRIEQDTLNWFRKAFPKGYQTQMNQILVQFRKDRKIKREVILERAQQLFERFHSQCFWHLSKELKITPALLPIIRDGLKKNGGREGYQLASEIELEDYDAD